MNMCKNGSLNGNYENGKRYNFFLENEMKWNFIKK